MIHDISIATGNDIIQFGDDVNLKKLPYLSREIVIWGNYLNWPIRPLLQTISSFDPRSSIVVSVFDCRLAGGEQNYFFTRNMQKCKLVQALVPDCFVYSINTPERRQSKMLIQSLNLDLRSLETEFSIAACCPTDDK